MTARDSTLRSDVAWRFDAPSDVVWSAMARPDRYPAWWPWLRSFDAGAGLVPGTTWSCVVVAPLRHRIRFEIELVEVDHGRRVSASLAGDIEGTASVVVRRGDDDGSSGAARGSSEVRLTSELRPNGIVLRTMQRFAPAVAGRGHDAVLRRGADQFSERALGRPLRG